MNWLRPVTVFIMLVTLATAATAQRFYRYVDASGNVVLASTVEPEAIERGYEILDAQGRVIEEVPAALSDELLRDQLLAERQAILQKQRDDELRALYSTGEDVEFAKQSELAQLELVINNLHARITRLTTELQNQQQQAALAERRGQAITDELQAELASLEAAIKSTESEVALAEQERDSIAARFDADKARLEYIVERERAAIEEAKRQLEARKQSQ
ncbi:DUF4124 domain-containing protein [Salinibius halmophilus]|uniref:DUF4124 domain-containing protein n=1 Tax=Salinibius halmophilus TaxID=1853216 RepID=UPI000E665A02|nr:DUF4124 domain-containing protein [Salinibius halmophilus]